MPTPALLRIRIGRPLGVLAVALGLGAAAGCGHRVEAPPRVGRTWIVGRNQPRFDPLGPPDPVRWALERLLTRGLVEEDSSGRIVPAAAQRYDISPDGLTYTFYLRDDLTFVNGATCTSRDVRLALESGLERADHATKRWLLRAMKGVTFPQSTPPRSRRGPPVSETAREPDSLRFGIETPDARTVIVRLAWPDTAFLRRLAVPGVCELWKRGTTSWGDAVGLGPYRIIGSDSTRRLVLALADSAGEGRPDTLAVRFVPGVARVRAVLRTQLADLVWPLPLGTLDDALPVGYHAVVRAAWPRRMLVLVMRPDLPPTTKLPARQALAHGINRSELLDRLGIEGAELDRWLPGAPAFDFPALDDDEIGQWRERGHLGRSFHVTLTYDTEGLGGRVAREMQGEWAGHGLYVELNPLRDEAAAVAALAGTTHLGLVEEQALAADPVAQLAAVVTPGRGPAVGAFRTGWRTREFDPWLVAASPADPIDPATVQRRIEEERIVLPLAALPWVWVERDPTGVLFHPHFGPSCGGIPTFHSQIDSR